jgi:inositol transport system ATP-binding protein
METQYVLEMENITKAFPGVRALSDVQLRVRKGTVHGLMGENGAGKSTLMKCLIGIYVPDSGTITFKGETLHITSTHYALSKGISMIHQELSPVPQMTVAENIYLGREPLTWYGLVDMPKMNKMAAELLERLHINIKPTARMVELSIAQSQLVEIAKAVSYDSDLIIMDEPTSAITEAEVGVLFSIIRSLKAHGRAIIYITHKMDEVFKITDEVTVFRDGQYMGTEATAKLTEAILIEKMVGRTLTDMFHKEMVPVGEAMLDVENLSGRGFRQVSFQVKRGEILGLAGLMGAGRTELIEGVFGVVRAHGGTVRMNGKNVVIKSPKDAIAAGMALLTEDRKLTGLYINATVRENMFIANIHSYLFGPFIRFRKIEKDCERMRGVMRIKTPSLLEIIKNLSGGNQQKVLISRWLLTDPDLLILDEPTRGIDVGAKSEVYRLMTEFVKTGRSIIMISSELPEVLGMSDRIMVMHEGDKVGELTRTEATQEKILQMATGMKIASELAA